MAQLAIRTKHSSFIEEKLTYAMKTITKHELDKYPSVDTMYNLAKHDAHYGRIRDDLLWITKGDELKNILTDILIKCKKN